MSTTIRTFTVAQLDLAGHHELHVEAESIFDAPFAYTQALFGKYAALSANVRHGELMISGDTRRWFLHQIRIDIGGTLSDRFIIVTAD